MMDISLFALRFTAFEGRRKSNWRIHIDSDVVSTELSSVNDRTEQSENHSYDTASFDEALSIGILRNEDFFEFRLE